MDEPLTQAADREGGTQVHNEPPTAASVRRTRYVCYWMVMLFNIPMWAFLPGMLQYINDRRCETMGMQGDCDNDDVNASAARYQNWTFALPCNIPNAITALALGTLSDWYGRKPVLLVCTATQCIGSFGAALVLLAKLDLWWFVPFFFVNGLGGASWVFVVLVMAALGDTVLDQEERTREYTRVMGLFFFCSAVGPILGGSIEGSTGHLFSQFNGGEYQAVFVLFFVSNVLLVLTVAAVFRETKIQLLADRTVPCSCSLLSTMLLRPTTQPLQLLWRSKQLLVMAGVYAFAYLGFADRSTLISLYAKKEPYSMSSHQLGWFLASIGVARSLAVFVVLPLLLRFGRWLYGDSEIGCRQSLLLTARIGMVFAVVFTSCFGLADDQLTLFVLATVEGLDGMWDSCLRVLMSELGTQAGAGEGEVLGVIGFCQVFLGSIAPPLFQNVYASTLHWYDSFVFLLVAFLTLIGLILTFRLDLKTTEHDEAVSSQHLDNPSSIKHHRLLDETGAQIDATTIGVGPGATDEATFVPVLNESKGGDCAAKMLKDDSY